MRNIKLIVEYDGTNYFGWQKQTNLVTVQGELEKAIEKITNEKVKIIGAGRTDKGAHGIGQVANFFTNSLISGQRFRQAINRFLPDDIVITYSEEVDLSFHSRHDALGKKYRYLIYNDPVRSPILRNYSYHVYDKLDFEKMYKAKDYFIGIHDFSSFMNSGSGFKNTIKNIHHISLTIYNRIITFEIYGNGFLYNMVRIMVGTLIDVGNGKIALHSIPQILKSKDRKKAGHTAPPEGLYLEKVYY